MTNQEAIRNLKDIKEIIYEVFPMTEEDKELSLDLAIKALEERPKGKWIEERDKRGHLITRKCPICKAFHDGMIINFCPNCGARMEEE